MIVSFVISFGCLAFVSGQYQEDAVNNDLASSKNEAIASGNQDQVRNFLKNYYLARWTQKANLDQLHLFREELKSDAAALSGAYQSIFLNTSIEELANMVKRDEIWPAVRYNAALAIGMFNESETSSGSNNQTVPYNEALPTLLAIFSADAKLPDYVTLAVLINLDRYAALGISDEENRKKVIDAFLEVLESSFGKKRNYTQDAVTWMQMKAVEGLTAFGSPSGTGSGTTILDTFLRLLTDDAVDSSVQNLAIRGIGSMNFNGSNDYDFTSTVAAFARFAEKMTKKELDFINEEEIRQIASFSTDKTAGPNNRNSSNNNNINESAILANVVPRIRYDLESLECGIIGTGGRDGVLANLSKEEQLPLKNSLESILDEIERSKNFFEFGADALNKDFDPKQKKGKKGKNTQVYYSLENIKELLGNQQRAYQGIVETAAKTPLGDASK